MRSSLPKTDAQFDFLGVSFRPPQQEQEICRLPRAAQLPPITGSPPIEPSMTVSTEAPSICTTVPSPMLPLARNARSVWKRFLIASAMSALVVGYLMYGSSHRGSEIASPSVPPSIPMSEDVPQPAGLSSVNVEGRVEPEAQANLLQPGAPSRIKRVEIETDAKSSPPPQPIENRATLDETSALSTPNSVTQVSPALPPDAVLDTQNMNSQVERKQRIVGNQVSTCYPSASAVRQEHPQAWPSWTMRALGHEGTRCWYPGTRPQPKTDASLGPNE
jgi:hypothetical protein